MNPDNAGWYSMQHKEVTPLIEEKPKQPTAPMANSENDDLDDNHPDTKPYPAMDDGFFNNLDEPDGENIPQIGTRLGEDGAEPEKPATVPEGSVITSTNNGMLPRNPNFPYAPGFGGFNPQNNHDFELGTIPDLAESIPDVNVYQHKKTLAQGMMDLALFSANANQLRYVVESSGHPYFWPSVVMISISLLLQIAIGVGLIWNSRYNVRDEKEICIANKINNYTVIGIFIVTSVNVFISAFGVASPQTPAVPTTP